jgi:hypothetical protein
MTPIFKGASDDCADAAPPAVNDNDNIAAVIRWRENLIGASQLVFASNEQLGGVAEGRQG